MYMYAFSCIEFLLHYIIVLHKLQHSTVCFININYMLRYIINSRENIVQNNIRSARLRKQLHFCKSYILCGLYHAQN